MKKILFFIALILSQACNYLELDAPTGTYDQEGIYAYYTKSAQMLTNVYTYIPEDYGVVGGAMRDCGSDDAEYADPSCSVQSFSNGNWSSLDTPDSQWSLYYGIRAANEFIESIADADFSRYENDSSYDNWMIKLQYHPYEARMIRAHLLFELARRYGDIAMPLTTLDIDEANTIEKSSFEDVIEFIVQECDECAPNLPLTYMNQPGQEFGRITQGFAMAIKSKALLYAASELHNETMSQDKWERSAQAALDIINLGQYSLDPSGAIAGNNVSSSEIVFTRLNGNYSWTFELANFPIRFVEGNRTYMAGAFPTQNLVDAFQTINGYDVTLTESGWECDDPAFTASRPYLNRDPRLAQTVLYNGSSFKGSEIQTYAGGLDNLAVADGGSATGYYLRKYLQEETSFVLNSEVKLRHYWVVYRYAETLLTYAESMMEAFGSPTYTDEVFYMSAAEAVNLVRANAGMPTIESTIIINGGNLQDDFMDALRNEWRVEFAFEDHRFWDIRRWKIGASTQTEIYGASVTRASSGDLTYQRYQYEKRTWNDRMYLYPIPQTELYNNPNLAPQNTGW